MKIITDRIKVKDEQIFRHYVMCGFFSKGCQTPLTLVRKLRKFRQYTRADIPLSLYHIGITNPHSTFDPEHFKGLIWPMKSAYSAIQGFDWVLISCVVRIIQIFRLCTLRVGNPYSPFTLMWFKIAGPAWRNISTA